MKTSTGFWLPALLVILLAGCSHPSPEEHFAGLPAIVFAPQPPSFLKGPMSSLLTNTQGFSARITQPASLPDWPKPLSGQFLGQGSKLLFAAEPDKAKGKHPAPSGLIFVWDVAQNSGFVMSDTLQGYAPISSSLGFSNRVVGASRSAPQKIDGHPCSPEQVTVSMNDGSASAFEVWRAADLNGFPVRIDFLNRAAPLTVILSQIRLGPPPGELFAPPQDFTKYPSAEAMMTEIAIREQHLKGRPIGGWGENRPMDEIEERPPPGR